MTVLEIIETTFTEDSYDITALVDDMQILYHQTHEHPAEYCPAVCRASMYAHEDVSVPTGADEFLAFVNEAELDWEPVNNW